MHCLVFTDTDLYSLTKGKSYLAKQTWRRSTCLRDQCYDVGCHPWIRARLKQLISKKQNKLQRGFTEKSSPMDTALILEEYIRDSRDIQVPAYLAFLDAKSALDVLSHKSLMRKLFNVGGDGNMWTIDRSKAVLLLLIFNVFFLSCVCYVFVRVCLYLLCGHLLGKS